ncbi:MAG: DsbA family protein [Chitinophagales bacterium]|nr:DsbA family protein [Chitinophagales bacterium]
MHEAADRVQIVYYTDPLCCWSWVLEPQWRKFAYLYKDFLNYRYCMGGMVPDWKHYDDTLNSVSRPAQMGPLWMQAHHISGMPLRDRIWMENPPASSFRGCIAVKCAQMQSSLAAEKYLRELREAIMIRGWNIAQKKVLLDVARIVANKDPHEFDVLRFEQDLSNNQGTDNFRQDLAEIRNQNITCFPTLTFKKRNSPGILIYGYRSYSVMADAIKNMISDAVIPQNINVQNYQMYWGSLTNREIEEVTC